MLDKGHEHAEHCLVVMRIQKNATQYHLPPVFLEDILTTLREFRGKYLHGIFSKCRKTSLSCKVNSNFGKNITQGNLAYDTS